MPFRSADRRPAFAKLQKLSSDTDFLAKHVANVFLAQSDKLDEFFKTVTSHLQDMQKKREEESNKTKAQVQHQRQVDALAENAIPKAFLGQHAYPQNFRKITTKYSPEDFERVKALTINGNLDSRLGTQKTQFLVWLNSLINSQHAYIDPSKNPKSFLGNLVSLFRGH